MIYFYHAGWWHIRLPVSVDSKIKWDLPETYLLLGWAFKAKTFLCHICPLVKNRSSWSVHDGVFFLASAFSKICWSAPFVTYHWYNGLFRELKRNDSSVIQILCGSYADLKVFSSYSEPCDHLSYLAGVWKSYFGCKDRSLLCNTFGFTLFEVDGWLDA